VVCLYQLGDEDDVSVFGPGAMRGVSIGAVAIDITHRSIKRTGTRLEAGHP
jgi:hypothetical protein